VNLAETGLELAVACFNQLDDSTPDAAWTGWTLDPTPYDATTSPFTPSATRTFTGFTPGPGATASIKVFAQHYAGSTPTTTPKIVSEVTITQDNAPPIHKYIEVLLKKRSLFGDGVSAIDDITVVGGNFVGKSWDSDPDNDPSTAPVSYLAGPNTANLTMGSVTGDISLGGGEVWGYAKVSDSTHTITGGSVHGTGPAGTADDPNRRLDDFDASFPMPTTPSSTANTITANINSAIVFPRAGDTYVTEGGKQIYYYVVPSTYKIDLGGPASEILSIAPAKNVVFILNNRPLSGALETGLSISGSASLQIGAGATLNIYTDGDVSIGGGGLVNANASPSTFMLWGTRDPANGAQSINVVGNGVLTGVIYAPNADLTVSGGGTGGVVAGAVVGKTVSFNRTTQFYYDEMLADLTVGNPYGASKWKELQTASERAVYATALSF
jgi:hypothetical protein